MSRKWVILLLTLLIARSAARYMRNTILKPIGDDCPDFGVHYTSARVLGTGLDFYDTQKLKVQAARFGVVMELDGTNHPPFLATLLWPLTWLPYDAAKALWIVLNQFLVAGTIALLSTWTGREKRLVVTAALVVIVLSSGPVAAHFAAGQVKLLVLFMLVAALVLFGRRRDAAAGILVGVAAAIQLYPAVFSLYFAWKRAWRAFAASLVTAAVAAALTISLLGWRIHAEYLTEVIPRASVQRDLDHPSNQSIYAVCLRLFADTRFTKPLMDQPQLAKPAAAALSLLTLAGVAYVCRRRERPATDTLKLEASLLLLAVTVIVSHGWDLNFVATFLPLAVSLECLLNRVGSAVRIETPGKTAGTTPALCGWLMAVWLLAGVLIHFDVGIFPNVWRARVMVLCPRLFGSALLLALMVVPWRGLGRARQESSSGATT